MSEAPLILWFRRDLRLADQPMLAAAAASGRPVIPVAILDEVMAGLGAAPRWRWGLALEAFAARLAGLGLRLILRRGPALAVLERLVAETGAAGVWWSRLYDPDSVARDRAVKAALRGRGLEARSFPGFLLHEPWTVQTGQGGCYRVFTPYWRALRALPVANSLPPPRALAPPPRWPGSEALADWRLDRAMDRGAAVVRAHLCLGEVAAADRLAAFLAERIGSYAARRDFPAEAAGSGLAENLAQGEIGPRQLWNAGILALEQGVTGTETFLRELAWREFSYHLLHHFPELGTRNWRAEWDGFPWQGDSEAAERWRRGMTGEPFVDAGMRELYVTGRMHNRLRMVTASYLTKHLLTDWRLGLAWFEDCLIDWDPAANAMGWQWVAGSGPDAAPYFRIFNPASQAEKFDPEGGYRRRFLAEFSAPPGPEARAFFAAAPRAWRLDPAAAYPAPVVGLAAGRARALAAYAQRRG